jgi:hypothetical protein
MDDLPNNVHVVNVVDGYALPTYPSQAYFPNSQIQAPPQPIPPYRQQSAEHIPPSSMPQPSTASFALDRNVSSVELEVIQVVTDANEEEKMRDQEASKDESK